MYTCSHPTRAANRECRRNIWTPTKFFHQVRIADDRMRKPIMRNVWMTGTAGLILAIGVAGAANANNANVPAWSPLSINTNVAQPMHRYRSHRMSEGRAAYVTPMPQDGPIFSNGSSEADHMATPDNNAPGGVTNEAPLADH
jgi:hypothetical protein